MTYIEHYDAASNQYFEIPEFDITGYKTLEDFVSSDEDSIQAALLSAVYHGVTLNLKSAPVFAIKESDSVVTISKDDYLAKINMCIIYYSSIEEYEICATLVDLSKLI